MGDADKVEKMPERQEASGSDSDDDDYDPHYEPLMHLPLIDVKTLEEDEEVLWSHRAQLYRFDDSETPGQWKQRGTGLLKMLKHKTLGYVRILMRRDVTLKVCANHYIQPYFELRPHDKSDRAWVWCTPSDFADEEPKKETLAIRFKDLDAFQEFHIFFEKAKTLMKEYQQKMLEFDAHAKGDVDKKEEVAKEKDKEEETKLAEEVAGLSVA